MISALKQTMLGVSGLLLFAPGTAVSQATIRMEAEDMGLNYYRIEALDFASGGALINLKGSATAGTAAGSFPGPDGQYDIYVVYHDENDGLAQLRVTIDSNWVDSWTLDFRSEEEQPKPANRLTREIATGYWVKNGSWITIFGVQGLWDNANVDYIEFVAADGGSGGTGNPPVVLDFSGGDVIIHEPGYYVLDRDGVLQDYGLFEVRANDVTIDFRGFTLECEGGQENHIYITADRVTLKNGTISGSLDLMGVGGSVLTTDMRLNVSTYLQMGGEGCRLQNSMIATELHIEGCIAQSNRLGFVEAGPDVQLLDNLISGGVVVYESSVFARNTVALSAKDAVIVNSGNQILDNLLITETGGDTAMEIRGTGNLLRGNILRSNPDPNVSQWNYGIVFLQDGNFYGDNLISAQVPFELGGTTQVDLGGNQGL